MFEWDNTMMVIRLSVCTVLYVPLLFSNNEHSILNTASLPVNMSINRIYILVDVHLSSTQGYAKHEKWWHTTLLSAAVAFKVV